MSTSAASWRTGSAGQAGDVPPAGRPVMEMRRRSSWVMVAGLVMLVLGLGNWQMGSAKMRQYRGRIAYAKGLGGPSVVEPFRGTASILERRSVAHELYEDARTKFQYYKLVSRGGRLLIVLGTLLSVGAVVRKIVVPLR